MGEMVELGGPGDGCGYLALSDSRTGPGVLVIQEWWGLKPQLKGTADHLAESAFVALASDLYRGDAIAVAVPFYGYPMGHEPDWSGLSALVHGHFCAADEYCPADGARHLEQRLQGMGKDVQITFHDAPHALINETNSSGSHDPELTGRLWPEVVTLLADNLT